MPATITGPRIEILVDTKGETEVSVFGIQGEGCKIASAEYDKLFGDVIKEITTAEAYEEPEEVEIKAKTTEG